MRKIMYWAFIALLCINVLYVFAGVVQFPLRSVDAYSDWMFKAKVLYLSPTFPTAFFQNWEYMAAHMQYPILLPTLFSVFYSVFGFHDHFITLVYPLLYIAILLLCWKSLRLLDIHPHLAIACTYIYSMLSPLLAQGGRSHAGNADIVLVLIYWIIIAVVLGPTRTNNTRTNATLTLLAFLVMCASQIKTEGILIISLFLFVPLSHKKRFFFILISLLPSLVWSFYVKQHNFASDIVYGPVPVHEFLLRTGTVVYGYLLELVNYRNWYIFWILTIACMYVPTKLHEKTKTIFLPTTLVMLVVTMGSYVFAHFARTEISILRYVTSSADRVLFQLSPFVFLYFAQTLSTILRSYFSWPKVSNH